jgi:ectoine hydroxylase-related dioxygenase (phytanoyl-CoA dioxygenase family)
MEDSASTPPQFGTMHRPHAAIIRGNERQSIGRSSQMMCPRVHHDPSQLCPMNVVPCTHRTDLFCHGGSVPSLYVSKDMLHVPEGIHFIKMELKAGDVLFFHGSVVHSSGPNVSKDRFRRVSSFFVSSHPGSSLNLTVTRAPLRSPDQRRSRQVLPAFDISQWGGDHGWRIPLQGTLR